MIELLGPVNLEGGYGRPSRIGVVVLVVVVVVVVLGAVVVVVVVVATGSKNRISDTDNHGLPLVCVTISRNVLDGA